MKLHNELLPIHKPPQNDELLSSWLIRLAYSNLSKVESFCTKLFGYRSTIWNRDIDRLSPNSISDALAKATGLPSEQIYKTTLRAYEGLLYEQHRINTAGMWLIPLGINHRSRKYPGLMYCPECLKEPNGTYYRRRWRLAAITVCVKHNVHLQDACPQCSQPMAPHRVDMKTRHIQQAASVLLATCWQCGYDLRMSPVSYETNEAHLTLQRLIVDTLDKGYVSWAGNPSMHSLVFFGGLRSLIFTATRRYSVRQSRNDELYSGIDTSRWPLKGIEIATLSQRNDMMRIVSKLCEQWPSNFIDFVQRNRLRRSSIIGNPSISSYWYASIVQSAGRGSFADLTTTEAHAIAHYTKRITGKFSIKSAR